MIGSSVGEAAAFAAGLAIAPLLEPVVQELRNVTWVTYPDRPLDPGTTAEVVAEGVATETTGASEAALSGISAARFHELVHLAYTAPQVSEARDLVRRGHLTKPQLHEVYAKAKLSPTWWDALDVLLDQPLPPAVAALAA